MPTPQPRKDNLPGGIVLCALPAVILFCMHINGRPLPMPWPILFGLFFLYGARLVIVSLFKLDLESAGSWLVDAVATAGFGMFAFWIAWTQKTGWVGNVSFLPNSWTQTIPRILFALGGLVCVFLTWKCLRKAFNQSRNRPDDTMTHV